MRVRFTAAPGGDLRAISLPGSFIRGVEVDNRSGSWLQLLGFDTFIPPYTLGWSVGMPHGASSVDIVSQDGPAGQVSTSEGSHYVVHLTDDMLPSSAGSPDPGAPFIRGFTPSFAVDTSQQVPATTGLANQPLIPGVAGRRIRLLSISARVVLSFIGVTNGADTIGFTVHDDTANVVVGGRVGPDQPSYYNGLGSGLDCPVGAGVNFTAATYFCDEVLGLSVTYQVI